MACTTKQTVHHFYVNAKDEDDKLECLRKLYEIPRLANRKSLVYVNNKRTIDMLVDMMRYYNEHTTDLMRGDQIKTYYPASNLNATDMQEFHTSLSGGALITTEPLATKLDLCRVPVVVNYDVPECDLMHYMSRVDRMTRFGVVINIVTPETQATLSDIQRYFNVVINEFCSDELTRLLALMVSELITQTGSCSTN